jgi:serine acetyltransferase
MESLYHILGLCPDSGSHLNVIQSILCGSGFAAAWLWIKSKFMYRKPHRWWHRFYVEKGISIDFAYDINVAVHFKRCKKCQTLWIIKTEKL